MLISAKIDIKTSFLVLLFSLYSGIFQANANNDSKTESFYLKGNADGASKSILFDCSFLQDTVKSRESNSNGQDIFTIPRRLADKTFRFQVNSEFTYLKFSHFRNPEAKKNFFQAWIMEKELNSLSRKTDSLRKIYTGLANEQKELISNEILKNEKRLLKLNEEIPVLFEEARRLEGNFLKTLPEADLAKLRGKISQAADSVDLANQKLMQQELAKNRQIADTLTLEVESAKSSEARQEAPAEIIYKIQIGSFKGKIPDSANKMIKKLSILRKVENYTDEKGYKIYTTGSLKNMNEATTLLNQVKQEGVKNPVIAAFQKGKRIPLTDGKSK